MASFVSEILSSAGQLEKRDLQTEIGKVNEKIEDAKFQVAKFLEQHYTVFNPLLVHSQELAETSSNLSEEFQQLLIKAETELKFQLQCSTNELTSIGGQIAAAKVQVNLLERVARLHDLLESLKKFELEADVVGYAKSVSEAEKILAEAEDGIETELEVWSNIQSEVEHYKNQLMKYLDDGWNLAVEWGSGDSTTLKLGPAQSLIAIFTALSIIEELDRLLCDLGSRILEEVLLPLLKADSSVQCEDELQIIVGKQETEELESLETILKNLSVTFKYLVKHFNFDVNDGGNVLVLIGRQISDEFSNQLVKNCLKSTLPASSSLLSSSEYIGYLDKVTQFEKALRDIGFISDKAEGSGAMAEFVANVDVFFADKVCLESLTKARRLMCVDLHDTIELKGDNQADQTLNMEAVAMERMDGADGSHHLWKMLNEGGMEMKSSPFSFPICQISRATQQLIELLSSLINEAVLCSATERCAARLLFTVRSICELYVSVVPEYHRDNLEQLPFHAAVAHNNGMYLAHSILTLGTSHLIKILNQNTVPLMDLVGKFRQLAAHIFLDHMKRQRQQLLTILKEGGFNRLGSESRLPASTENAIRQCLHQLRNLQKIWQPVLPQEVYLRAVGTLSNSVLDELLIRITNLEDIPADAALQLVDQCQVISTTLPLLFVATPTEDNKDPADSIGQVMHYIHLWPRFQELQRLLGAGLKDIEDRWSSGRGPLSAHFSADEVKQMIRALFQNTDHRAAILARIK